MEGVLRRGAPRSASDLLPDCSSWMCIRDKTHVLKSKDREDGLLQPSDKNRPVLLFVIVIVSAQKEKAKTCKQFEERRV